MLCSIGHFSSNKLSTSLIAFRDCVITWKQNCNFLSNLQICEKETKGEKEKDGAEQFTITTGTVKLGPHKEDVAVEYKKTMFMEY